MYHVVDLGDSLRMFSKKRGGTKELEETRNGAGKRNETKPDVARSTGVVSAWSRAGA